MHVSISLAGLGAFFAIFADESFQRIVLQPGDIIKAEAIDPELDVLELIVPVVEIQQDLDSDVISGQASAGGNLTEGTSFGQAVNLFSTQRFQDDGENTVIEAGFCGTTNPLNIRIGQICEEDIDCLGEPGETCQLLHADDGMITLPRPHAPTMATTLWALTDFVRDNGATCFIPGSHKRPAIMPAPEEEGEVVYAEMPAGSVFVMHASLWHGGGANSTADFERYGLSIQYVSGWCRQQQNLMLGTPQEVVASYPRRLQELIGYSMYKNVMGHVNREHPLTLLGADVRPEMVWEKMERKGEENQTSGEIDERE